MRKAIVPLAIFALLGLSDAFAQDYAIRIDFLRFPPDRGGFKVSIDAKEPSTYAFRVLWNRPSSEEKPLPNIDLRITSDVPEKQSKSRMEARRIMVRKFKDGSESIEDGMHYMVFTPESGKSVFTFQFRDFSLREFRRRGYDKLRLVIEMKSASGQESMESTEHEIPLKNIPVQPPNVPVPKRPGRNFLSLAR